MTEFLPGDGAARMTRRAAITALAGAFVPPRDPLTDPRPGDGVEKNGVRVWVDFMEDGMIYGGRLKNDKPYEFIRCTLQTWREQCVGATVIQRAEEVADA